VSLAVTWWGHASTTVELGGVRVALDPLLDDRLFHLRRHGTSPRAEAAVADVVLVSHLHADHCHVPSLARFAPDVPVVVPRGAEALVGRRLSRDRLLPAEPGDVLDVAGVRIEVLGATHDGHRLPWSRLVAPALGFRLEVGGASAWFPGDTELRDDMADVAPVDLALAPVGGWGPTLGAGHMGPDDAAAATLRVGARLALPVHWGTFWPLGLDRVQRENHERLFVTPGSRFAAALAGSDVVVVPAEHGGRVVL
jgi:L-ascorbate metabolism protein UlaG (beta-lactamase superfamily)